ncbi:MAG: SPOR domain-containing protein [Terriglobia bacterium]
MADSGERRPDEKGLSARYLVLVFLMGVAACAVFFSLGFLVGYNERSSRTAGMTEQVTPSGVIPPTVNPPLETVQPTSKEAASAASASAGPAKPASSEAAKESKPSAKAATTLGAASAPPATATKPGLTTAAAPASPQGSPGVEVGGAFTVQVAASQNQQDAEKLVKELKSRGYAVFVVTPEFAHANDNLFRVQVGPFATREEAQKVRDKIAKEGFKPFIKH